MDSQVDTCVQTQIVQFKYIQLIECQLITRKSLKRKKRRRKQTIVIESRSVADWIQNPEGAWMQMAKKRTSWGGGNVLYLDCGGGNTTVYVCQNKLHT